MKKSCDYCSALITNKNTQFCNRECQIDYMRRKQCMGCCKWFVPEHFMNGHYCTVDCENESNYKLFFSNVERLLGYGHRHWIRQEEKFNLVEFTAKIKDLETGEIFEQTFDKNGEK